MQMVFKTFFKKIVNFVLNYLFECNYYLGVIVSNLVILYNDFFRKTFCMVNSELKRYKIKEG